MDAGSNVYITGYTSSTNGISSSGSHQAAKGGADDGFLVKFNSDGVRQWATYYGGGNNEAGTKVSIDDGDNVYMTGYTMSGNAIATSGAHQTALASSRDAFIVKFNSSGVRQWGTYVGGAADDYMYGCGFDNSGNIYCTGNTGSTNGISTTGSHQPNFGGFVDAFVIKFNSSGVRQWGTYYGGSAEDQGFSISVNTNGDLYITGNTLSSSGIATTGSHQTTYGGNNDGFIAKFNANGTRLWGSYYGGSGSETGYGICQDGNGNIYCTGSTTSTSGIATNGSYQAAIAGSNDAFLIKFDANGVRQWGTYYGGSQQDQGLGLCTNSTADIYCIGLTYSGSGLASSGSHQSSLGGGSDAYIAVFMNCDNEPTTNPGSNRSICNGDTTTLGTTPTSGMTYAWTPKATLDDSTKSNPKAFPTTTTKYYLTVTDAGGCDKRDSVTVTVNAKPTVSNGTAADECIGDTTDYTLTGSYTGHTFSWVAKGGTILGATTTQTVRVLWTRTGPDTLLATVTNAGGCSATGRITLNVNPLPTPVITGVNNPCAGISINYSVPTNAGRTYQWRPSARGSIIGSNTANNVNIRWTNTGSTPTTGDTILMREIITSTGCSKDTFMLISINPVPTPIITGVNTTCSGQTQSYSVPSNTGRTYQWSVTSRGVIQGSTTGTTATVLWTNSSGATTTNDSIRIRETFTTGGCYKDTTLAVSISPLAAVNASSDKEICEGTSTTLNATATGGTGTLTYSWTPTTGLNNATILQPSASPTTNTQYILTVNDTKGCIVKDTVVVTVNPAVNAYAGLDQEICNGQSVTLTSTASGGTAPLNYTWTPATGLSSANVLSPVASPSTSTQYILLVTDVKGCFKRDTVVVTVNPLVSVNASTDKEICAGSSTTLNATATGGTGALTYSWTPTTGLNNATILQPIASPSTTTQYILTVNDTKNCPVKDTVLVTVNPLPSVNAGADAVLCLGNLTTIGNTASGGTGTLTYSWSPLSGIIGASTSPQINVKPSITTDYIVVVTDSKGCEKRDTVKVTVNPKPDVDAGANTVICASVGTAIGNPATGSSGYVYDWTPIAGLSSPTVAQPIATPTVTTTYQVIVTDVNGCKDTSKIDVRVRSITTTQNATSLDYGTLDACEGSKTLTLDITNTGTDDILFTKQSCTSTSFVMTDGLPFTLAKGATKTLTIRFAPTSKGAANGTLTLTGDPCNYALNVDVKGEKLQLAFTTDKPSLNYGVSLNCNSVQWDSTIVITNTGTDKMTITSSNFAPASAFSIVSPPLPQDILANATLAVKVRYAPASVGTYSSELQLNFIAGTCSDVIRLALSGTHIIPDAGVTPPNITFPDLLGCDPPRDTLLTISNLNVLDVDVVSITPSDAQFKVLTALPLKVSAGQSKQIKLRFDPSANGAVAATMKVTTNPCGREVTVQLKGNKQGVSFSTPDTIDVGTLIACSQTSISKTFTIKNTSGGGLSGQISNVGTSSPFASTIKTGDAMPNGTDQSYTVTFTPNATTPEGILYGKIDVSFLPCDVAKTIVLKATKTDVRLTADATIDYGSVQTGTPRSRTINIVNTGTADMTIATVSGITAPFTQGIVTPALPALLKPNDTLKVEVIFTAQTGKFTATIKADGTNPCTVGTSTILNAEGTDKPIPSITGFDKNVGSVLITQTKPDFIEVTNDGTVDMNITGAAFDATSNPAFSVGAGQFPIPITVGEKKQISVSFAPTVVGTAQGLLIITGDKDTASARVMGTGFDNVKPVPSMTSTPTITFDSVCTGQSKQLTATLTNNGNADLQLQKAEWVTNAGNVFTTTLPAQPLAIGKSITQSIDFAPTTVGLTNAQIRWIADLDTAITDMSGIGKTCTTVPDTAETLIALRDITAQAGEKVNLVLYIAQQKNMNLPGAPKNFTAKIRYNPTMLFNERTQNVCVNTDVTDCQIEVSGTLGSGSDLALIPCIATLGSSDNSTLTLEDFQWTDGTVKSITQTQNGKITITGTCEQGGVRLYIPASNSTSLTTRPNPAQNSLQIQYGLREPLNVTLELLNMTGQVVQTIINNQAQAAGGYLLTADLSLLGTGVYQLRLLTGVETLTTRVDVVK